MTVQGRATQRSGAAEEAGAGEQRRVAMITRSGSSVGRATVLRFAKGGADLVLCDPDAAVLRSLEREAQAAGARVVTVATAASSEADAQTAVDAAMAAFGRVDAVINGTVDVGPGGTSATAAEDVAQAIRDGVQGALACTRRVLPHMIAAGGGQIVNVISSAGRYRSAYFRHDAEARSSAAVAGADGAVFALTRELAFELAPHRIRVNAVTVGWIRTPSSESAWQKLPSRDRAMLLEEISLRRLGEPDEVAAVIDFLAGPASSYVTGCAVDVNGGLWMS